ncbi:hypothetical protein TDB9533_00923 [Thalassocella blandensis]|nr:hypothetical protein TDB9533_00923 [Thalassocella blandensis]
MSDLTYLSGYYGMQNSGDDALMLATAWGARKYLGDENFKISNTTRVNVPGFGKFEPPLKVVQRFKGENRMRQYHSAIKCDRIIFGGGSVLHNSHDIGIKRHLIKLAGKDGALALGIGIGPFRDARAEYVCAEFLKECEYVGVRDQRSFDIARSIAPDANVEYTFDLAPLLLLNEDYQSRSIDRSGICVCLCSKERFDGDVEIEEERVKKIAQSLEYIYKVTGRKITLLDFNGHLTLGDNWIHNKLKQYLPAEVLEAHILYTENPLEVMQVLETFELVIGMRLHAVILSYLVNTPVISLNYHQKCSELSNQIGLASSHQFNTSDIDHKQLTDTIEHSLSMEHIMPTLPVTTAIEMSLKNWRVNSEAADQNIRRYSSV